MKKPRIPSFRLISALRQASINASAIIKQIRRKP